MEGACGAYHEGVPLTGEDLDGINRQCVVVNAIDLNNCHVVAINGERVIGIARDGYKTETISK